MSHKKELRVEVKDILPKISQQQRDEIRKLGVPSGFGIIKLLDDQGKILDVSITKTEAECSRYEMISDMFRKIINMLFSADPNIIDTAEKGTKILDLLGVSLTMDGIKIV